MDLKVTKNNNRRGYAMLLIIVGILFFVIDFYLKIGSFKLDIASDIIGFIFIALGLLPFIKDQNRLYRQCFSMNTTMFIVEIIAILAQTIDFGDSASTVALIFKAINTIIFMRFIYYYMEANLLQGKMLKIELDIKPLRNSFFIFCIMVAMDVIIPSLKLGKIGSYISIATTLLLIASAVYFCGSIYSVREKLYPFISTVSDETENKNKK